MFKRVHKNTHFFQLYVNTRIFHILYGNKPTKVPVVVDQLQLQLVLCPHDVAHIATHDA